MYQDLKSYQNAIMIHDFTVEFVKRYIDPKSRTTDQMAQAARSGKQNIAEGAANSRQKPKSETMLLGVASASLKELLEDYKDYLRQHQLQIWSLNDMRALRIRNLYKTNPTYTTDQTYQSYQTYLSSPESACNAMICLISQTTYLLDNQIKGVEKQQKGTGLVFESREQRAARALMQGRMREAEIDAIIKEAMKSWSDSWNI